MLIQLIEIGNFRKLKAVRVELAETTTVFVGANNSGKTSAMIALRAFLVDASDLSINDFTLANWRILDDVASRWERGELVDDQVEVYGVLPHVDLWLRVPANELHYVQRLLPTLDWDGELIGVRLQYEPKNLEKLKEEYLAARAAAKLVMDAASEPSQEGAKAQSKFELWPRSFTDFLARRLRATFQVRAYLLDPAKLAEPSEGLARPQALPAGSEAVEGDPLQGLIQVDEINAQRGLGSASRRGSVDREDLFEKKLSKQLRSYYERHLDPFDQPVAEDLQALQALHEAETAFGTRLTASFKEALGELETIGYPGVSDPKLILSPLFKPVDGLSHPATVLYQVAEPEVGNNAVHRLPEESNGLGYQNLVSIVFALMGFRDGWMRKGKAGASVPEPLIAPLHLVLLEEPEAHLHAQVQQVFINQAYDVLRRHPSLGDRTNFRTQMVVSTHSSHIAHEVEFSALRYFRRLPIAATTAIPIACIVNLSEVFGDKDQTKRFVKRYLKATHCDLFFADAVVMVEGPAEKILIPHFVRSKGVYEFLRRCYITWLEIGGSHAHRLRSLIAHLGIDCLVITDLDAKNADGSYSPPKRAAGMASRNETLRTWVPGAEDLDVLLDCDEPSLSKIEASGYAVRVAYQQPVAAGWDDKVELLANTFEDAILYENVSIFEGVSGTGLLGRLCQALAHKADPGKLASEVSAALSKGGKAEFALDLLYRDELDSVCVPSYIDRGLQWLGARLRAKEMLVVGKTSQPVSKATEHD